MWTKILPTVHSSRTTAGSNTRDCAPLLILCNVNPIRGSKLFLLPNGDKLYDEYIRNYSLAAPFLPSLLSQIAETEVKKISHQLQDMLKSCRSGEGECHSSDFLFTRQGTMACYTMQLNETADQRLQLVLDPQEYDYLLPNDGFVGFMTTVVTSQSVHQLTENDYVSLGSRFHSFVDVRYSWNENCVKPEKTPQTGCPAYYVRSVTQTSKLPMFIKPVNVGHGGTILRNSTEVHFASTVQKRAYLRTNNHTALKMLTQIALELAEAIRDASNVTNFLHQLRIHLSENLHRMDYLMMINVTAPTVSEHLRKKECLSQTRNALSQFDNDPLIPGSFPNGFILSSPLAMSRKELELYLIDCFYDAQTVTFPSAAFLRKTLKAVMKLHLQFSNVTETGHISEAMEQARSSNGPSESSCRKLTADYAHLLEQVGSRASAALSKMENVNNGLHGVIRDNRILRAAYSELAGTLPQTLSSSLVTTTLRISKEVRPVDKTFSVFAFGLMRSKLLSIILNVMALYVTSILLIEFCFSKWRQRQIVGLNNTQTNDKARKCNQKIGEEQTPRLFFTESEATKKITGELPEKKCEYCPQRRHRPAIHTASRISPEISYSWDFSPPVYRCKNDLTASSPQSLTIPTPFLIADTSLCTNKVHHTFATTPLSQSAHQHQVEYGTLPVAVCRQVEQPEKSQYTTDVPLRSILF